MDAKHSLGEPRALISRDALVHNAHLVRSRIAPGVKICAVLKADAYGHDSQIVLATLTNFTKDANLKSLSDKVNFDKARTGVGAGRLVPDQSRLTPEPDESDDAPQVSSDESIPPLIDAVAVASIDEAEVFPRTSVPVLVFRPIENTFLGRQRDKLETAIRSGWTLTVTTSAAVDDLTRIAQMCQKRANVQVMLDTGMTRSGVGPQNLVDLVQKIDSRAILRLSGICTHFASSEESNNPFTGEQLARYRSAVGPILAGRAQRFVRHAANSGAIFFHPGTHLDMVRPGISLYGIDPTCSPSVDRKLKPVLKWTAPIIELLDLPVGGSVGYNQSWSAKRASRIALVPVGYADGYLRAFSNRASMMLHDQAVSVVGKVSMDLTTIDVTDLPAARVGDEVTLLDSDPLSPASVYNLARLADTIPYEIFCRIGARVRRVAVEPADVQVEVTR